MELTPGVELVWLLAGREASSAQTREVEPDHFFCALLKFADMTQEELKAVALLDLALEKLIEQQSRLKWHLHLRELDNQTVEIRHAMRQVMPRGTSKLVENMPHRSEASRQMLERASTLARKSQEILEPHHLLYALLECPTPVMSQTMKADHLLLGG